MPHDDLTRIGARCGGTTRAALAPPTADGIPPTAGGVLPATDPPIARSSPMSRADALVLFGATGDLARKKLFSALYGIEARNRLEVPVIGVALSDWSDERFREHAQA